MNQPNWANQTVWTGDNLLILRGMNSECVGLICLDPPFNSNADYAAPIGSEAAGAEFKDTWSLSDLDTEWINLIKDKEPQLFQVLLAAMTDSDKSYLAYMAVRLLEMHRILKPTGSIYLHCDPTMSHYLKLVLDAVFGKENYVNELIWYYKNASRGKKRFAKAHDVIFWYSKVENQYQFKRDEVLAPFESGMTEWRYTKGGQSGKPMPKGKTPDDVIVMPSLNAMSKERTGYPTQKPLDLYKHFVKASSDEGDIVFDPFCGCATTCIAAESLERQWCGIDISGRAIELTKMRLRKELGIFANPIHRTDIPQRTDLGRIPPYNSAENRRFLYGEQSGDCAGCGEHFSSRHLEIDHIIARSKGGTGHISNLQLLCGSCNRIKGDRGMEYLRKELRLLS